MNTATHNTTISNRRIRLAVEQAVREERIESKYELARVLGISSDTLRNRLGYPNGHGTRTWIDREFAAQVIRELGLEPIDMGL